ncbi:MAG: hypothetical protein CSA65_00790 [Proteobacteria bacterium]|nr:MAG: hypothetical protein CSB49_06270 [Pseudomonadota bacterium]PIE19830.1 MAG: hypothetical protein CSA65_00790 [Pseudomonadota bacterium]
MTRVYLCVLALLLALPASEAAAKPSRRAMREARRLYKEGQQLYERGSYSEAAKRFEKGYTYDRRPAFLINAAQAYRRDKQPERALEFYKVFIEVDPQSRLRSQVEGLIAELEAELNPKPISTFVKPPPPKPQPKPIAGSTPFYKKWWFWAAVGVVVVGTATGVGVAVASGGGDDYVKEGGLGAIRW